MPATLETQRAADRFVYGLRPGGETAAYNALEAAFHFDAEAIYFLSDGEPNAGRIPLPAAIVAAITQANRTRRMSIYTIGIAPGAPGRPLDTLSRRSPSRTSASIAGWISRYRVRAKHAE